MPLAVRGAGSKTVRGKGGRKLDAEGLEWSKDSPGSAGKAKQGADVTGGKPRELWWVEASIWTERMVSALGNGVKGGKWFSLMDKVVRPATLEAAWQKVARNKGAAGVDGQSIERFAAGAERYLAELHEESEGRQLPAEPGQTGGDTQGRMARPVRWAYRRSRIASSRRLEDGHRADL